MCYDCYLIKFSTIVILFNVMFSVSHLFPSILEEMLCWPAGNDLLVILRTVAWFQGISDYEAYNKYPALMKGLEDLDKEISGGTTATVVLIYNGKLYVANVGECLCNSCTPKKCIIWWIVVTNLSFFLYFIPGWATDMACRRERGERSGCVYPYASVSVMVFQ